MKNKFTKVEIKDFNATATNNISTPKAPPGEILQMLCNVQ